MSWQQAAACRDADPELFFPPSEDYTAPQVARQLLDAGRVCAGCPVRRDCLTYAVETGPASGIWAGHSPAEVRAIRRARREGTPDPEVDRDPMCPACSLLFAMPAVDGQVCWLCQEKGAHP